ncbi:MAG: hypothetical protein JNL57_06295 [Bacteroidetes bacterium]|nr:hypothetical protein [Bacteroidota bacterium]
MKTTSAFLLPLCLFLTAGVYGQKGSQPKPQSVPKSAATPARATAPPATRPVTKTPELKKEKGIHLSRFSMDMAPGIFIPFGNLKNSTKVGPQLGYFCHYHFSKSFSLGLETGMSFMLRKRSDQTTGHVIPWLLQGAWHSKGALWVEGGAGFLRDQGFYGKNAFVVGGKQYMVPRFAWRAGLGLRFTPSIGLALRWESAKLNNQLGIALRYTFVHPQNHEKK